MSFKEDVKADINSVFFDTDEFAEVHMVNGREMRISIDEAELAQRTRSANSYEEAIHTRNLTFYVAAQEFGRLPKVNSPLTIDHAHFVVADTRNESGTYRITLIGGHR